MRNLFCIIFLFIISSCEKDYATKQTYRVYDTSNSTININTTDGLTCLEVDSENNVWFGAKSGNILSHYSNSSDNWQATDISALGENIWAVWDIDFDVNNNMWVGTNNGIFKFTSTDTWTSFFNLSDPPFQSIIRVVHIDKFNNVWCDKNGKLFKYDGIEWTHMAAYDSLTGYQIQEITSDNSGNLWIGCYGALIKYDGTNFIELDNPPENTRMNIYDIEVLSSNNLWIGANGGLHNLIDETWHTIDTSQIINPVFGEKEWIVASIATKGDIMQFGTWSTGLATYDNQSFSFIRGAEFNIDSNRFQVNELEYDNNGNLWIATRPGQVIVYNENGLK